MSQWSMDYRVRNASSAARKDSAGLPAASPATATPTKGFKQWLDGASRHPIVVGLVLLGVLALITGLGKLLAARPNADPSE
jgi:hypothetical protein